MKFSGLRYSSDKIVSQCFKTSNKNPILHISQSNFKSYLKSINNTIPLISRSFSTTTISIDKTFPISDSEELIKAIDETSTQLRSLHKEPTENVIKYIQEKNKKIRNLAIIAHVDHGKTTLVDSLLKAAGQGINMERAMDSNELEQEKGITIVAKSTSVLYKDYKINIIDTPGHQDFGGEVERVLSMVDSVLLVVCSSEGTMKQTKFVLKKAIMHGLKPIVVINKVDRPSSRIDEVENDIFDLFCSETDDDKFLSYVTLYTSAKKGFVVDNKAFANDLSKHQPMTLILDKIIESLPSPQIDDPLTSHNVFKLLATQMERDVISGNLIRGKIYSGFVEPGSTLRVYDVNKTLIQTGIVSKMFINLGIERLEIRRAVAGDIVTLAGFEKARLTHSFTSLDVPFSIDCPKLDPPLMTIELIPNNSPFAGQNGAKKMSLFDLRTRLEEEAERDLALQIKSNTGNKVVILGRGDLHIGILLERMRREGYEFQITSPTIVLKQENGVTLEPQELITIDVKFTFMSILMEKVLNRNAILKDSVNLPDDYQRIIVELSSRAAIGFNSELISETNNDVKYESTFIGYKEYDKIFKKVRRNVLLASSTGKVTSYGMRDLERFGTFFIKPGNMIYKGQVIAISKDLEMEINPTKEKKLSNVRNTESEEAIRLIPPKIFTIEEAMTFILEDEYLEITPIQIRIRKIELNSELRKRYNKQQG